MVTLTPIMDVQRRVPSHTVYYGSCVTKCHPLLGRPS